MSRSHAPAGGLAALAALVTVAAAFAGCASTGGPAGGAEPRGGPFQVDAPGANVEQRSDGAVVHYTGQAVAAQGRPVLDARWVVPHTWSIVAEHPLAIPAGTTLVRGFLNWTGTGSLLFLLSDDRGEVWCGALAGTGGHEDCLGAIDPPREVDFPWTVQVLAELSAPSPTPIPYTLDVVLTHGVLPHLGPPAPFGSSAPLQFAKPVALGLGDEPSLAVTPSGTVYVAARVFESGGLWSSPDGRSFAPVTTNELPYCEVSGHRPPAAVPQSSRAGSAADDSHLGCGDTDVSVSGDGTVYFASHWGAEAVAASHDSGATWFSNPFGSGPQVPHTDRQWLAADGPMRAYLAYIDVPGIEGQFTNVARTDDGGLTWLQLGHAIGNACLLAGGIVTDSRHNVYMSGCTADGPALGVSTDLGVTWTWRPAVHEANAGDLGFTTITVDKGDNVHLSWITSRPHGGSDVYVASSKDQGRTWTAPSRVNHEDGTFVFSWITSGDAGKVGVTYYGTKVLGAPDRLLGDWYPVAAITSDAFAASPVWSEAAVDDHSIQYGPICVGGNGCANARNLGDFFQVQAGPDGALDLAYADGSAGGGETLVLLIPSATVMYSHQTGGPDLGSPSLDKGRP